MSRKGLINLRSLPSLVTLGLAFPLSFWMFNRVPCVTTLARI